MQRAVNAMLISSAILCGAGQGNCLDQTSLRETMVALCSQAKDPESCPHAAAADFLTTIFDIHGIACWNLEENNKHLAFTCKGPRARGEITSSSHLPYDIYLQPLEGKSYMISTALDANNSSLRIKVDGQIYFKFMARNRKKQFISAIPWYAVGGSTLASKAFDRVEASESGPLLIVDEFIFSQGATAPSTDIYAIRKNAQELTPDALNLIKTGMPFKKHIQTAANVMCMFLGGNQYGFPYGDAGVITKLFMRKAADGKGEDGRTSWTLEAP